MNSKVYYVLYYFSFLQNLPVTRTVDSLMEMKPAPETDDFRYFDPKMLRADK